MCFPAKMPSTYFPSKTPNQHESPDQVLPFAGSFSNDSTTMALTIIHQAQRALVIVLSPRVCPQNQAPDTRPMLNPGRMNSLQFSLDRRTDVHDERQGSLTPRDLHCFTMPMRDTEETYTKSCIFFDILNTRLGQPC